TTSRDTRRGARASPGTPGRSRKPATSPIRVPDGHATTATVPSRAARTGRIRVPAVAYPSTATSATNPKVMAAGTREARGTGSAAGRNAATSPGTARSSRAVRNSATSAVPRSRAKHGTARSPTTGVRGGRGSATGKRKAAPGTAIAGSTKTIAGAVPGTIPD